MAAQLTRGGGPVYARIMGGFSNVITYDLYLKDAAGASRTVAQRQDQNPGSYLLSNTGNDLDGDKLLWGVDVVSPSEGANQMYSVTMEVIQGGVIVPGGRADEQDQFDGVTVVTGEMELSVA